MKRISILNALAAGLAVILLFTAAGSGAQPAPSPGQVLEGLSIKSTILGRDVKYAIYLPPDYQTSGRRYPVVYLLHGFTDNESAWVQFGEVNLAADRAIAAREIPPMVIVMPDGGVTWYINDYQNKVRYEDMFIQEFIPRIDATYRTRPEKEFRGVAGLSMGGWGALLFAMRHPDLFTACAAYSAAVWAEEDFAGLEQAMYERMFGPLFGPTLAGQDRLTALFRSYNPLSLAMSLPVDSLKKVRYYIDCGDEDFLFKGNALFHLALRDRKVPDEFRCRSGTHSWVYWRTGIGDGLKFIGESFHR